MESTGVNFFKWGVKVLICFWLALLASPIKSVLVRLFLVSFLLAKPVKSYA
jgi:hypothetical protein